MAKPAVRDDSPPPPPVREEKTDPLSQLRQYPPRTPNTNNKRLSLSLSLWEQFASASESIKNILISDLTTRTKNSDIEAMVDLANNAFASLDSLHVDYSGLYAAVRDHISYHRKYSLAKEEEERNRNELSCLENLCGRLKESAEALNKADAEMSNWTMNPVLLKELLAEKSQVQSKVDVLRQKYSAESSKADNLNLLLNINRVTTLAFWKGRQLENR